MRTPFVGFGFKAQESELWLRKNAEINTSLWIVRPTISPFDATMTRGNQRELAREKNAKKQAQANKGKKDDSGLSASAKKERDADVMRQKQAAAAAKKESAAAAGASGGKKWRSRKMTPCQWLMTPWLTNDARAVTAGPRS